MKQIVEIVDRLNQGVTEATLCRADDGQIYVVKNQQRAGANALIAEWIAARIGIALGLPIPASEILLLERSKARFLVNPDAELLARAPSFGSRFVNDTVEFSPELSSRLAEDLKSRVLLFDYWVRNEDRTDGNTNMLWVAHEGMLHVIDHNLAFDQSFNEEAFWTQHIFRESRQLWDAQFRAQILEIASNIMACLDSHWNALPPEWTELGGATTQTDIRTVLAKVQDDSFWQVK